MPPLPQVLPQEISRDILTGEITRKLLFYRKNFGAGDRIRTDDPNLGKCDLSCSYFYHLVTFRAVNCLPFRASEAPLGSNEFHWKPYLCAPPVLPQEKYEHAKDGQHKTVHRADGDHHTAIG